MAFQGNKSTKSLSNTLARSLTMTAASPTLSRKFSPSGQDVSSTIIPALAKSSDMLESEYIKNLQRQIYFLEMETKYLREQVKRASDLQPIMAGEAAKMLEQLRTLTAERDSLRLQLARRDVNSDLLKAEKGQVMATLAETQGRLEMDKRGLLDQVIEWQNKCSVLQLEAEAKDRQITSLQVDLDSANQKVADLEARLQLSVNQHDVTNERLRQTQIELERKLVDVSQKEAQIRSLDAQLYDATVISKDKSIELMNAEIISLRQRLRDAESKLDQDKLLALNSTARSIEDAYNLRSTLLSPRSQLVDVKLATTTPSLASSALFTATVADRQRLQSEADFTRTALLTEKQHGDQLATQLRIAEDRASRAEINSQAFKNRLREIEMQQTSANNETSQLRNEKAVLINHMQELQKESMDRERELTQLRRKLTDVHRSMQAD